MSEDIYDLSPFNMDYEEDDHIEACREGTLYIDKVKANYSTRIPYTLPQTKNPTKVY